MLSNTPSFSNTNQVPETIKHIIDTNFYIVREFTSTRDGIAYFDSVYKLFPEYNNTFMSVYNPQQGYGRMENGELVFPPIEKTYDAYIESVAKHHEKKENPILARKNTWLKQVAIDSFRGFLPYSEPRYNIADIRTREPNIDAFLDDLVLVAMLNADSSYAEALSLFKLDDEARKHIRSLQIEGLEDMPYLEVTKKLGDLYYEPLAVFLDSLSETFAQSPNTRATAPDIKTASEHILNAWEICKIRLQVDNSPKHTHTVADIPNGELGKRIGMLAYDELYRLISLLAEKIQRDAEADAGRNRVKLARELFATANLLSGASKKIESIYSSDE